MNPVIKSFILQEARERTSHLGTKIEDVTYGSDVTAIFVYPDNGFISGTEIRILNEMGFKVMGIRFGKEPHLYMEHVK